MRPGGVEIGGFYDWFGLVLVSVVFLASAAAASRLWPADLRRIVLFAAFLRIPAAVARLEVARQVYRSGDYGRYFNAGWAYAWSLREGDTRPLQAWLAGEFGNWWGTQFVEVFSGATLFIIGPTLRGEFVAFAALGFFGTLMIASSLSREMLPQDRKRFVALALLFPSMLYWPSSIGKEALILFGCGLLVSGYLARKRTALPRLVAGFLLLMAIRPHIALLAGVAIGVAEWMAPVRRWTAAHSFRAVALLIAGALVVRVALGQFGLDEDGQTLGDFVAQKSAATQTGGSAITQVTGPLIIPMSFVNVLLRPFVWEAGNPMMAFAALEVLFIGILLWRRRHSIKAVLRAWRTHRTLRVIVPLLLGLIAFYGGFVSNLGILARQRVVVLPFVFAIVYFGSVVGSFPSKAHERRGIMSGKNSRGTTRHFRKPRSTSSPTR